MATELTFQYKSPFGGDWTDFKVSNPTALRVDMLGIVVDMTEFIKGHPNMERGQLMNEFREPVVNMVSKYHWDDIAADNAAVKFVVDSAQEESITCPIHKAEMALICWGAQYLESRNRDEEFASVHTWFPVICHLLNQEGAENA